MNRNNFKNLKQKIKRIKGRIENMRKNVKTWTNISLLSGVFMFVCFTVSVVAQSLIPGVDVATASKLTEIGNSANGMGILSTLVSLASLSYAVWITNKREDATKALNELTMALNKRNEQETDKDEVIKELRARPCMLDETIKALIREKINKV